MSKVYRDDEWRNCPDEKAKPPTRAEEQSRVNLDYAFGRIDLSEWRRRSDELSEPTKWATAGKLK